MKSQLQTKTILLKKKRFLLSISQMMYLSKKPTIVGILTFMSTIMFMLNLVEHEIRLFFSRAEPISIYAASIGPDK